MTKPTRRSILRGIAATVAAALVAPKIPALGNHAWTLVRIVEPRERQDMKLWAYMQQYGASVAEIGEVWDSITVTGRFRALSKRLGGYPTPDWRAPVTSAMDYKAIELRIAARWIPQALWRNEAGEYACTFARGWGWTPLTATPMLDPDGTWDQPFKAAESRAMRYHPGNPPKPGTPAYTTEPEAILGRRLS